MVLREQGRIRVTIDSFSVMMGIRITDFPLAAVQYAKISLIGSSQPILRTIDGVYVTEPESPLDSTSSGQLPCLRVECCSFAVWYWALGN